MTREPAPSGILLYTVISHKAVVEATEEMAIDVPSELEGIREDPLQFGHGFTKPV